MIVVGALHVDEVASLQSKFIAKASNPVIWARYVGGVASNAARAASSVYDKANAGSVTLHAPLGHDSTAQSLLDAIENGVNEVCPHFIKHANTGRYSALMSLSGELTLGLADVGIAEKLLHEQISDLISSTAPDAVMLDANLSQETLIGLVNAAQKVSAKVAALTVSPAKAIKLLACASGIQTLFCNRREAIALCTTTHRIQADTPVDKPSVEELADHLSDIGFNDLVISDGADDLLVLSAGKTTKLNVEPVAITHNVNGAGDTLAGASLAANTLGISIETAVKDFGLSMSRQVLTGERAPIALSQ